MALLTRDGPVPAQGWSKTNAFHICITSYKLVIQDQAAFRRKKWKYLVLDEVCSEDSWVYAP